MARFSNEELIEIAWQLEELVEQAQGTESTAANLAGINRQRLRFYRHIIRAHYDVQRALVEGRIKFTHARTLAYYGEDDEPAQLRWLAWLFEQPVLPEAAKLEALMAVAHPRRNGAMARLGKRPRPT